VDQAPVRVDMAGTMERGAHPEKSNSPPVPGGRVLLSLWSKGQKNRTTPDIRCAIDAWASGCVDAHAALIPTGLRIAIAQATAKRKSVQMGLSGAHDGSKPSINAETRKGVVREFQNHFVLTQQG
jgi:hypothetical protein